MISLSPKSVARLNGVTVAGIPILTLVSHPASNITDTMSAFPAEKNIIQEANCQVPNSLNHTAKFLQ